MPKKQSPIIKCCKCDNQQDCVWIVNDEGVTWCLECFDRHNPRQASVNRFKGSNEQLEMPLW